MSDELSIPDDFDSDVRLFPLPNVVFFPQVMLPLHIFEPRYREMAADALAGDHLVAMALLKPGWEPEYEGRPGMPRLGWRRIKSPGCLRTSCRWERSATSSASPCPWTSNSNKSCFRSCVSSTGCRGCWHTWKRTHGRPRKGTGCRTRFHLHSAATDTRKSAFPG